MPSSGALKEALRAAVRTAAAAGELDSLSVNKVRGTVEKKLKLKAGFFSELEWKDKSKQIVKEEAARCQDAEDVGEDEVAPTAPSPPKKTVKPVEKKTLTSKPVGKGKRTRTEEDVVESAVSSSLSELDDESAEGQPQRKRAKNGKGNIKNSSNGKKRGTVSKEKKVELVSGASGGSVMPVKSRDDEEDSESEMSEVLDEPPPRKRSKPTTTKQSKSSSKPKGVETFDPNVNPDEQEIKRLQSWLLKCGIRKIWHKELAPYDTLQDKIIHLKEMLSDAGMDGRRPYSDKRAKQIKEERELKADLEAVKGFDEQWGQSGDDNDVDIKGRPKRRLAKGLTELAMFDEDDESD